MRFLGVTIALALGATIGSLSAARAGGERAQPMRFEVRQEGPASACAPNCRVLVSAAGAITAQTLRDFQRFAASRNLHGATLVLDSDGGSVHGAMAFGREVRRLEMATTVGSVVDLASNDDGMVRARLLPRADCESMCTFVLLAGTRRSVPADARVMVHQIWLGDRREDPTAANYSAEDLVLVQRDIGRLAKYTAEMGGPVDLLELALRIPPWEPMHSLTREELQQMRLDTAGAADNVARAPERARNAASTAAAAVTPVAVSRNAAISERGWAVVDRSGTNVLARRHPLTIEGDEIGSFDLTVACGANPDIFAVSYIERRHAADQQDRALRPLTIVTVRVGGRTATLKVNSSERSVQQGELNTYATGNVPAELIKSFAETNNRSMMIKTESDGERTYIRIGNTGAAQNLPILVSGCHNAMTQRADAVASPKTGGLAQR